MPHKLVVPKEQPQYQLHCSLAWLLSELYTLVVSMTQWDFTDFIFLGYLITAFFSIITSQSSPPNSAYIGCIMMNWDVTGSYYSASLMQYRTGSKFSDAIMHATSWHDNKINSNQLLMFTLRGLKAWFRFSRARTEIACTRRLWFVVCVIITWLTVVGLP